MTTINWQGHQWLTRARYGMYHPDDVHRYWYDSTAVEIRNGSLILKTHPNPHTFHIGKKEVTSPMGIGRVNCTTEFGYGLYEIEAKLPTGNDLWPAFWIHPFQSWPPEIDILEAYTAHNRKGYFKPFWKVSTPIKNVLGFWDVQTNIHYRKGKKNFSTGGRTHWLGFRNPRKHFTKYSVLIAPDRIVIYYNGREVRRMEDKAIMQTWHGKTFQVILNNALMEDAKLHHTPVTEFTIKSFKYTPVIDL